jgi:uncharacterized membrane protein YphA (DoxX/SURF4 family)
VKWVTRIVQGLLAALFLMSGGMKVSGDAEQAKAFTDVYGYPVGFMYVVGALEVLAVIGLVVGYWKPKIAFYAAGGLVLMMAGAVVTHLQSGEGIGIAMIPLVLLILAVMVVIGRRYSVQT